MGFPLCVVLRVLLSRVRGVVGGRWGSCVRGLGGVAAGWRPWCVSAGVCRGGGVPRSEPVGVGVLVRGGRWGLVVSWLAAVSAVLYGTYSYVLCLMTRKWVGGGVLRVRAFCLGCLGLLV